MSQYDWMAENSFTEVTVEEHGLRARFRRECNYEDQDLVFDSLDAVLIEEWVLVGAVRDGIPTSVGSDALSEMAARQGVQWGPPLWRGTKREWLAQGRARLFE